MNEIDEYLDSHREAFEADLCEFLKIPSVSADSKRRADVRQAAEWVAARLEGIGLAAELIETPGHPVVYAESPAVPGAPTALVYGHYDVQPPDPLDEWVTPPFEPTVRDGNIYARGATDDKGQLFTHLASVQAWMATALKLPIQVKFLIEGEEEVGSENLEAFIAENIERLACDCIVISDTSQFGPGQPAITYGLRGIAYYELRLRGPRQDLHSGTFGGGVINPAVVLTRMLSALFDERGRVAVPQFYDDVESLGEAEREQLQALPFNELHFMEQLGVEGLGGENGYSTLERRWVRPSCDINGLWSGYQGEGAKTVLPARAGAKLSFRLVPRQDPKKISADLRSFFRVDAPGRDHDGVDRISQRAGYRGIARQSVRSGGGSGSRRRLRPHAGDDSRRGLDPGRYDIPRAAGGRYIAVRLGAQR